MNWNKCLQLDEFPNYCVNPHGQIFNSKGVEKKCNDMHFEWVEANK